MENQPKKSVISCLTDRFYQVIQWTCMLCLAGQVVIISYAVVGRFVLNHSPAWAEEISRILMVWMSLLSASLAVKDKTHVRMTVFDKLFGKTGLKIREVVFVTINFIFFFFKMLFNSSYSDSFQPSTKRAPVPIRDKGASKPLRYHSCCRQSGPLACEITVTAGRAYWEIVQPPAPRGYSPGRLSALPPKRAVLCAGIHRGTGPFPRISSG